MAGGDPRFLLGTDSQGADVASLILYGLRSSLLVGVLAVSISVGLGTVAGLISGYVGGQVDRHYHAHCRHSVHLPGDAA